VTGTLTSLAVVAVGIQLALQAPVNSALGSHVGRLAASLVSFAVGTLILVALVLVTGEVTSLGGVFDQPAWESAGGLIGASFVAVATLTVARIGAGAVVAATVTGQLLSSLVIDDRGLAGVDADPLSTIRVVGALLLVAGTLLVVLERPSGRRATGGKADRHAGAWHFAVPVVFAVGLAVGFQHPMNAELGGSIGELNAGLVNFCVGTALLSLLVGLSGRAGGLAGLRGAPPWQLAGGLIGVVTVVASLSAVPVIGAAALTAALVTGQLLGSVALDRFGALGLDVRPVDSRRAAGVLLLLAGTVACVA
jgi:transporter family-2 protein